MATPITIVEGGFDLAGKLLVIPVVSTANVAQLAVDILIETFNLNRVANLDAKFCIPVVGGRENGEEGITTPLELYGRSELGFVVLQQRSPPLRSKKQEFVDSIIEFVKTHRFSAVLLASGLDLSNRTDSQMATPTYQVVPPQSPSLAATPLKSLTSLPIPTYKTKNQDKETIPIVSGGGLARRLLTSWPGDLGIPVAALLQFVIEGDNRLDAAMLAGVITRVLEIDPQDLQWKQPKSWARGLFGTRHDQSLYG